MPDFLTPAERSARMALVRGTSTKPELALRRHLQAAGLTGYRLNHRGAPGAPDIAYTRWKVAIFVDGAFWHGHPSRHPERLSTSWRAKIRRNQQRDAEVNALLDSSGWTVIRLWDFEVQRIPTECVDRVTSALAAAGRPLRHPRRRR
ncbi:very short patch repair endonuclease [Kribbella koreensis]|uniref:Very short patch repair endonuclease n=1 Tax=Kribbella koreensis TaxID=57909 RepID=A0ABN1PW42_9ACTN